MKLGTRSVLFGVHQFAWHPLTVVLAWRRVHGMWPNWWQTVAIACHDLGYWGCSTMDGEDGLRHPEKGARMAGLWVCRLACGLGGASPTEAMNLGVEAYFLALYHSIRYSRKDDSQPSALYLPDKASVLFEPRWFYLLRARLSGEIHEYIANSPFPEASAEDWFDWYRDRVLCRLEEQ